MYNKGHKTCMSLKQYFLLNISHNEHVSEKKPIPYVRRTHNIVLYRVMTHFSYNETDFNLNTG